MKLRHQILVLLALPIICQLVTVGIMSYSFTSVDAAATKELTAKQVISLSQEINGLLGQGVMQSTGIGLFGEAKDPQLQKLSARLLDERIARLRQLVAGNDAAMKVVDRYQNDCHRFLDNWQEVQYAYNPGRERLFFAQFLLKDEYVESMKLLLRQLGEDSAQLTRMYAPVVQEFQPKAIKARGSLRDAVFALISMTVLLTFVMALVANRKTLERLQILMNNMRSFSRGNVVLENLDGHDELAELNQAFKDMSSERQRLDEIRKSLQAMVSHDLRSPLTAMNLTLQLILDKKRDKLDPQLIGQLERLSSESQRLCRLSKTLLDIEKIEDGKIDVSLQKLKLSNLSEAAIRSVQALARAKSINVSEEFDSELELFCDEDRTIQVLVNLLSNAVKFSPVKSVVHVRGAMTESGMVRIEVEDEGPGIPEEKLGRLFAKFSQLEQSPELEKEGSGLGLFICKTLVEAQGGQIGYAANSGARGYFWFDLPAGVGVVSAESGTL